MVACSKETWELALIWPPIGALLAEYRSLTATRTYEYITFMTLLTSVFKGGKLVMSHPAKIVKKIKNVFSCLKGRGPLKFFFNRQKYRGFTGLSIDTTHTPPPSRSFYSIPLSLCSMYLY